MSDCKEKDKDNYDDLFDDDNPLIGTWECEELKGRDFLIFIDDSTVRYTESIVGRDEIYAYKFDHTPMYEEYPFLWKIDIWTDSSTPPDFDFNPNKAFSPHQSLGYLSEEKIVCNPIGVRYIKIKE